MNFKTIILSIILILMGIGISFTVQAGKEKPKITLISLYDNYQINPELITDWGFAIIVKHLRS